jgi:hypothetical protein
MYSIGCISTYWRKNVRYAVHGVLTIMVRIAITNIMVKRTVGITIKRFIIPIGNLSVRNGNNGWKERTGRKLKFMYFLENLLSLNFKVMRE